MNSGRKTIRQEARTWVNDRPEMVEVRVCETEEEGEREQGVWQLGKNNGAAAAT